MFQHILGLTFPVQLLLHHGLYNYLSNAILIAYMIFPPVDCDQHSLTLARLEESYTVD